MIFGVPYQAVYEFTENYIILQKYIKCVFLPLTEMMGPTMNLISGTHHFCEMRDYTFNILLEYDIIILNLLMILNFK